MKKLIEAAQHDWTETKAKAAQECEAAGDYTYARNLNNCTMFHGDESLEEMIKLMFSPRGIEFLIKFNFPPIETFRKFKKHHPERFGVYIDCGNITLNDADRVFLVGKTVANINYHSTQSNRLYLMHGAKAKVLASGFSVLKVEKDETSKVNIEKTDNAVIL